jgi:hypothetical protein
MTGRLDLMPHAETERLPVELLLVTWFLLTASVNINDNFTYNIGNHNMHM